MAESSGNRVPLVVHAESSLHASALAALLNLDPRFHAAPLCADQVELAAAVQDAAPAVLVIEVRAPSEQLFAALAQMLEGDPQLTVVLVVDVIRPRDIQAAMAVGVSGYLATECPPQSFTKLVATAIEGGFVLGPAAHDRAKRRGTSEVVALDDTEVRLLELVAKGHGNQHISRLLCVSESTLRRKTRLITKKMGAKNLPQAAIHAARIGLI